MKARKCIITLGVNERQPLDHPQVIRDFRPGLKRLEASLGRVGYQDKFIYWDKAYPRGSPLSQDSPCGFKPFCFLEAAERGCELVLWLDATIEVVHPIDELFHWIERDGYLLFSEDHSVGEYCKDEALEPLGISREESFSMPCCWACVVGLDLRNPKAVALLKKWSELATDGVTFPGPRWSGVRGFPMTASKDPRVKGHRYDQTAASVVALSLGMSDWKPKDIFFDFFRNKKRSIPTLPDSSMAAKSLGAAALDQAVEGNSAAKIKVLFFSRGRGRGHAIPDMAIADELPLFCSDASIQFVSYATGAETFRNSGWSVIDLGLPESNRFLATHLIAHELIEDLRPTVVISHEEYAVLPAAHQARIPSILLTDWFPSAGQQMQSDAVALADSIVFMGEPGTFTLPRSIKHNPVFVGSVVRKMTCNLGDRSRVREQAGLPENAFVVSVIPGAWATEEKAPIADLVLATFRQLSLNDKYLWWLTKNDGPLILQKANELARVRVVENCAAVEEIMVASDLIITKGNRGTIMDAASLGIPSISLSRALNPIDEVLIRGVRSNFAFNAEDANASTLCSYLERIAATPLHRRAIPLNLHLRGGAIAAKVLAAEINRVNRRGSSSSTERFEG